MGISLTTNGKRRQQKKKKKKNKRNEECSFGDEWKRWATRFLQRRKQLKACLAEFDAESEEGFGGPRLPCENAAEKNPLSTSRNPKSVPREDFQLNDRWLMFADDETSCTRFSTSTTVALATGRGYNGPLCFSRSIRTPGGRLDARGGHQPPRSLGQNPLLSGEDL